ncbi:DUF742 domain-containing protein [Lentzea sp. NPDC058436]|uniref:DUF742 domain-containing protein n=1 Tax=Lentzea albida TaxID=65499 RepID=A0A1H9TRX6_9PSEU|nr:MULTISPECIES: DUF742 domain-containing protein [Lentzea]USX48920.1 DUF742 domain-containing protein [Lentzea sp. HUAS12]SER99892.1 Protein of unknown function [Lentzea albida]
MSGEPDDQVNFGDLMSGFSFDSERIRKRGKKKAQRAPEPPPEPDPYATLPFDEIPPLPSVESGYDSSSIVRAYAWTGGRTTSDVHLEIETLVSVNEFSATAVRPEHQDVLALCAQPRSVAEIAALRGLPLGVTKVLLGDMAGHGLIDVHRTASSYGGDRPDGMLLERVLAGLRRL